MQCRRLKRTVKSRMRMAAREYGSNLMSARDSSNTWKFIRDVTFSTTKGERVHRDINALNESFAKTVTCATSDSNDSGLKTLKTCDLEDSLRFQQLESVQVLNMLSTIKTNTSTGPDGISASVLKMLAPAIANNLAIIMNQSMSLGVFPVEWKKANVTAIWKAKGAKNDATNYRPISILSVLARMFERVIARQLSNYCYERGIIPQEQFGFRVRSSSETALIAATDAWMGEIDQGKVVGALLLDLSKAFDTVPHQQLLGDLLEIGCGQLATNWFNSYLNGREQRVTRGWKSRNGRLLHEGFLKDLVYHHCCSISLSGIFQLLLAHPLYNSQMMLPKVRRTGMSTWSLANFRSHSWKLKNSVLTET